MNITVDRKVIEEALEALEYTTTLARFLLGNEAKIGPMLKADEVITALCTALEQPQPVQVSPLDFTHAVLGKEDAVGRPIFWAEWPNREKA